MAPHSKLLSTQLARRRDARHPLRGRGRLGRGSACLLPWAEEKNHPPASYCAGKGAGVQLRRGRSWNKTSMSSLHVCCIKPEGSDNKIEVK